LKAELDKVVKAYETLSEKHENSLQNLAVEMATHLRHADQLGRQLRTVEEELKGANVELVGNIEAGRKLGMKQLAAATV
jgi:hypothetical protein